MPLKHWGTCLQSCPKWKAPISPILAALKATGKDWAGRSSITSAPCDLDTTCFPKHQASWAHPCQAQAGQAALGDSEGRGLGQESWWWAGHGRSPPPHPGNWAGQGPSLSWLRGRRCWQHILPPRRGLALESKTLGLLLFGSIFSCPLCLSRDHLSRVSNR